MAAANKTQLLNEVHALLKERYKAEAQPARLTVLEAVVYGICHEGTTREQANQALSRFKDDFFDWNEVRVSSIEEIQGVLAGVPDAEGRAQRIRRFLRQLFEKTYSFNKLDALVKKPQKEAVKELQEYEAVGSDYVLATVTVLALGGHAIPLDSEVRRGLERLGAAEGDSDIPTLRAALERAVPKNRGAEFLDLMEELVHDTCVAGEPDCPSCVLQAICPTGQARALEPSAGKKDPVGVAADGPAGEALAAKRAKAVKTPKVPRPK